MTSPHYNLRKSPAPREPIHPRRSPRQHDTPQKKYTDYESEEENNTDLEDEVMDTSDSPDKSQNLSVNKGLNSSKDDTPKKRTVYKPEKRGRKKQEDEEPDTTAQTPETVTRSKTERLINKAKSEKINRTSYGSYFLCIVCFVVFIAVVIRYFDRSDEILTSQDDPNLLEKFNDDMKSIKSLFPAQTPRFWKIIKVSLRRIIIENNPEYPAILLLVAPSGSKASATGTCIAQQLTKAINTLFNVTSAKVINIPNDIRHNNPDDEKKDLDIKIKDSFQKEHIRSIAVDHFEQLSPRASLLFHGYCDGDNAPFKNVAIVFILHTDLDNDLLQNDSRLVDTHLRKLWSSSEYPLDRDKIDPLIARVANNAAVITEEENLNC